MGKWVELVLLQLRFGSSNFVHMTCGVKGCVEDNSLPTHSMQFRHQQMVRCSVGWSSILCWLRDGFNHLGLDIGPINFIPTVNNLISDDLNHHVVSFQIASRLTGQEATYSWFRLYPKAYRARLRAVSVIEIESLGVANSGRYNNSQKNCEPTF